MNQQLQPDRPQPLYCSICMVNTAHEQMEQFKKGIPEREMMVHPPSLAVTWGIVNINGKDWALPICGKPEHIGVI